MCMAKAAAAAIQKPEPKAMRPFPRGEERRKGTRAGKIAAAVP